MQHLYYDLFFFFTYTGNFETRTTVILYNAFCYTITGNNSVVLMMTTNDCRDTSNITCLLPVQND